MKAQVLVQLRHYLPQYKERMDAIDTRLFAYCIDAVREDMDTANLYELLGIRKELRLMDTYTIKTDRVVRYIRAIEGKWENNRHIKGGLKFATPRGHKHVRLMPFQVWILFGIYGFDHAVCMEREYNEYDELLPTEYVQDGIVYDNRRLCSEAHLFLTRKQGKTELGGAIDFVEANILGPLNAQALICANSKDQAAIAFKAIKQFSYQIDPKSTNKAGGQFLRVTADETTWRAGFSRTGEVKVMSAGGKTKDGLYASLVHADEHGSASYTKGHSDMQSLVEVCAGSWGPRREKLLLHTTTAGLVNEGPYQIELRGVEAMLEDEMQYPLGEPHTTTEDSWFAFLLRLDPWELTYTLEELNQDHLFRKVNRSIGVTVQPTWYRERLHDAATKGEDTKKEVLTKDFNIWQSGRVTSWLKGDRIVPLQVPKRITDCKYDDGWDVFVGLDFSHGDDLFAITYLAVNYRHDHPLQGRFFADCEAWVLEETMKTSPNRSLYERWAEDGWLNICPGEVFDSMVAMQRLAEKHEQGINMVLFGYDPAQSANPINNLKAWLQTLGIDGQTVTSMVVPVGQSAMTQNPRVSEVEDLVKSQEQLLQFSMSPLWPWEFQNCAVETNSSDLRRILKGGPAPSCKMDNVAALINALYCFDLSEGRVEK